jgi:hypothetical protein
MPRSHQSAQITVNAGAGTVFDFVSGDLAAVVDDADELAGHRPLDDGPVRVGFRWRQRCVHNRNVCSTEWCVTELSRPRMLAQAMVHFCAEAQREVRGGERWELRSDAAGATVVELRTWRISRGWTGWVRKLSREGPVSATAVSLNRRLAFVQFEAERRAAART